MTWLLLHLPLHLLLLMLLAGLHNVVIYNGMETAVTIVLQNLDNVQDALSFRGSGYSNSTALLLPAICNLTLELGKLGVNSTQSGDYLQSAIETFPNGTKDVFILTLQFMTRVLVDLDFAYGITPSQDAVESYNALQGLNTSWPGELIQSNSSLSANSALFNELNQTVAEGTQLFDDFLSSFVADLYSGSLFFLPTALSEVMLLSSD